MKYDLTTCRVRYLHLTCLFNSLHEIFIENLSILKGVNTDKEEVESQQLKLKLIVFSLKDRETHKFNSQNLI